MAKGRKKIYTVQEYKKLTQNILTNNYWKNGSFSVQLLPAKWGYHYGKIDNTGCKAWVEYVGNQPQIVFSYPAATDQRTIRRHISTVDPILKDLCNLENIIVKNKVVGVRQITIPFGQKTGIKDFVKKRNIWIVNEVKKRLKRLGRDSTKDSLYEAVAEQLRIKRPFKKEWERIKNLKREVALVKDPYNLSDSAIKKIYIEND